MGGVAVLKNKKKKIIHLSWENFGGAQLSHLYYWGDLFHLGSYASYATVFFKICGTGARIGRTVLRVRYFIRMRFNLPTLEALVLSLWILGEDPENWHPCCKLIVTWSMLVAGLLPEIGTSFLSCMLIGSSPIQSEHCLCFIVFQQTLRRRNQE